MIESLSLQILSYKTIEFTKEFFILKTHMLLLLEVFVIEREEKNNAKKIIYSFGFAFGF